MPQRRLHHAWLVLVACFLCCFSYGIFYSFGVFFKSLQSDFGWGRGLTSTAQSLHWFFLPLSAMAMGWLTDRYGPRRPLLLGATLVGIGTSLLSVVQSPAQFYVFYSLASLGEGIAWSLPAATVQRWFLKKRGLALGITVAGIGAGYALAPLSSLLISQFGWRTAYLVLGSGMWLLLVLASLVMARSPAEKGLAPYGADASLPVSPILPGWEVGKVVRSKSFWLLCAMYTFHLFAVTGIAVHLVNFATDLGISSVRAASAWFIVGVFSIPGRILGGYAGEKMGYRHAFLICGLANALLVLWLLQVKSFWMLLIFVSGYGFFYGAQTPVLPGLMAQFFGLRPLATVIGIQLLIGGVLGGTTGPIFAGFIYDWRGSYDLALLVASGFWVLTAIPALLLRRPVLDKTGDLDSTGKES